MYIDERMEEMTVQLIMEKMDGLAKAHMDLLKLSKEKTEAIKQSNLKPFAVIVAKEQKLIQLIDGLEEERGELVRTYLGGSEGSEGTLADCLEKASSYDRKMLSDSGKRLLGLVEELRGQNELNRQLIQQSLQFINMNMALLLPEEDTYTYERPEQAGESRQSRSLFDSKA